MHKLKKSHLFTIGVIAIVGYFIWVSFTQPGIGDLTGEYRQVAAYRNENNTGPITRIYAVEVNDTLWDEMKRYGDFMLHTKYGNTKVFFFSAHKPMPEEVYPGEENFDRQYQTNCIARYEKNNIGEVSFVRYPFF